MLKIRRCLIPIGCVVALFACKRGPEPTETRPEERPRTETPTEGTRPGTAAEREKEKAGQTTVTGARVPTVSNDSAVQKIVAARCAREEKCANVGPKKHFGSHEACVQKIRTDMKDDLNPKDCPHGVDEKALNECVAAINKEECKNPIDVIGRVAACRTSDLCLKSEVPNR